jgi:hypothetical protein
LGDYTRALQSGTESLRLLPENPLLLVPLADVQVQEGLVPEAKRTAQEALECLDGFARPSSQVLRILVDHKYPLSGTGLWPNTGSLQAIPAAISPPNL